MKHRPIIGLCGYARAGKDTMAAALTADGWTQLGFANNLKHDLQVLLREALLCAGNVPTADVQMWVDRMLTGQDKAMARPLMVAYGAFMRSYSPNYWIERLSLKLIRTCTEYARVVITDVRYLNEADWVRSLGGLVVWLERPGVFAANDEELFKTLPDYCDVRLLLDGSIEENQAKFCKIAEDWLIQCRQGDHDAETH
jgi:hypothetical protein